MLGIGLEDAVLIWKLRHPDSRIGLSPLFASIIAHSFGLNEPPIQRHPRRAQPSFHAYARMAELVRPAYDHGKPWLAATVKRAMALANQADSSPAAVVARIARFTRIADLPRQNGEFSMPER